jgi:hypothetical protein
MIVVSGRSLFVNRFPFRELSKGRRVRRISRGTRVSPELDSRDRRIVLPRGYPERHACRRRDSRFGPIAPELASKGNVLILYQVRLLTSGTELVTQTRQRLTSVGVSVIAK